MPERIISDEAMQAVREAAAFDREFKQTAKPTGDGQWRVDFSLMMAVRLNKVRKRGETDSDLLIRICREAAAKRLKAADGMVEGNARKGKLR